MRWPLDPGCDQWSCARWPELISFTQGKPIISYCPVLWQFCIPLLVNHNFDATSPWDSSQFLTIVNMLFQAVTDSLLCTYPGLELVAHIVILCELLGETPNYFPQWLLHYFTFPPAVQEAFNFPTFSLTLVGFLFVFLFFNNNQPTGCKVTYHCWFYLVFQTCHRYCSFSSLSHPFLPLLRPPSPLGANTV